MRRAAARDTDGLKYMNDFGKDSAEESVDMVGHLATSLDNSKTEIGAEEVLTSAEVRNVCNEDTMDVVKENVNVDDDDIEASYQDVTDGISVIPLKKLKLSDDQFKKLITKRLELTNLMVKGITRFRRR